VERNLFGVAVHHSIEMDKICFDVKERELRNKHFFYMQAKVEG
jgi:hypothetical protein